MTRSAKMRAAGLLALAAAFAVPAATPAFADGRWVHHGGWGGGHVRHDWGRRGGGGGGGIGVGGVLLGLGVGAAVGAAIASQPPPPAYYAPPPAVYYGG
jgi:hypothetical protein